VVAKLVGIRKLLLTLFIFISSILLLVVGVISEQTWKDLNVMVIPSYLTANVLEHWLSAKAQLKLHAPPPANYQQGIQ
jgi:hypothetical protein